MALRHTISIMVALNGGCADYKPFQKADTCMLTAIYGMGLMLSLFALMLK